MTNKKNINRNQNVQYITLESRGNMCLFISRHIVYILILCLFSCGSPIVGGQCRDGYEPRDGICIFVEAGLDSDVDTNVPDSEDAGANDEAIPDSSILDGDEEIDSDSGPEPCDIGELLCNGVCVRPDINRDHCGDCNNPCDEDEFCADSECSPYCEPPLSLCGTDCVNLRDDPDNCGLCSLSCSTGICENRECINTTAGHVIIIGHDYTDSRLGMERVIVNAVQIAFGTPIRILFYRGNADTESINGVEHAIDSGLAGSRSWTSSDASSHDVSLKLANSDAFVIFAQQSNTDDELRDMGRSWSVALRSFLERGGVIILLDAPATHNGTYQILDEAELLSATGRSEITGEIVTVVDPGDAVATRVPITYRAERQSVYFDSTDGNVVVSHNDGPVVIHRIF